MQFSCFRCLHLHFTVEWKAQAHLQSVLLSTFTHSTVHLYCFIAQHPLCKHVAMLVCLSVCLSVSSPLTLSILRKVLIGVTTSG